MTSLLFKRRFGPFFLTQFLGAFNDNFYKTAMLLLIVYQLRPHDPQAAAVLAQMAAAAFILPFFLFSLWAGALADRYDKAAMIRLIKGAEILIMGLGAWGLMTGHIPSLFAALFGMGAHSAFFGPIKYAIIPQHVPPRELFVATAWVEAGTFLAILTGQLAAGLLQPAYIMSAVLLIAVVGYGAARFIPTAPPVLWEEGMLRPGWRNIGPLLAQTRWRNTIGQISLFWALGLVITTQLPPLVMAWLHASQQVVTAYLALFSIGIAMGALGAMWLRRHISLDKIVNAAALAIPLIILAVYFILLTIDPANAGYRLKAQSALIPIGALLWALSVAAGLYIVPLYVRLQQLPPPHLRAQLLGVNNLINAAFMVTASVMAAGAQALGLRSAAVFLVLAFFWLAIYWGFRQRTET